MNRLLKLAPVFSLAALFFAMGCGQGQQARLRVMNASPGSSNLNVLVDNSTVASDVAYGTATGYTSVKSGSRRLQVEPAGTSTAIIDQTVSLSSGTDTTILAAGYPSSIAAVIFTDDKTAPSSGNMKVRLINAVPGLGAADVYVVPPGTDLSSVQPTVSNLNFESASAYQSLNAGTWEVFFTLPGQKFAYLDSGPFTLSAGQIRTMVSLISQNGGYTFSVLSDGN